MPQMGERGNVITHCLYDAQKQESDSSTVTKYSNHFKVPQPLDACKHPFGPLTKTAPLQHHQFIPHPKKNQQKLLN